MSEGGGEEWEGRGGREGRREDEGVQEGRGIGEEGTKGGLGVSKFIQQSRCSTSDTYT